LRLLKPRHLLWIFLLALTLLRLRAATQIGLGVDEAHYVLYGKYLDWSYFDHPPLIGWVQGLFYRLPLPLLWQARLAPLLISLWSSWLVESYLLRHNFNAKTVAWSVAILNLTPMMNALSLAMLPDTLLLPLTVLIIQATEELFKNSDWKNWLKLGLFLGLAGLSKYTAVLYVAALGALFIKNRRLGELLRPKFWGAVLAALLLISPVLYWNLHHDFASFKYQAHHVLSFDAGLLKNVFSSFSIQFFVWGLVPFVVAFGFLFSNFRKMKTEYQSAVYFNAVFLLFFFYVSLSQVLLPHWMLIFFVLGIPLAYADILSRRPAKTLLMASLLIPGALSFLILIEAGFKVLPARLSAPIYSDIYGWDEVMKEADLKLEQVRNPAKALAVMNWTLGSRATIYSHSRTPVYVVDSRYDQFDIWAPLGKALGKDLIVLVEADKKDEHLAHLNCGELTSVGEKISTIGNVEVKHFLYYHCADFLGYKD
jgi:4-amino-4-deoxy-L-arabinose transferase-like glycosyltransferase